MVLTRAQKEDIIKGLQEKFSKKETAIFLSLHGVDVKASQALRRKLERIGELYFVKKTLLTLALKNLGVSVLLEDIAGPFGIAFDYTSQTNVLKILSETAKKSNLKIIRALWETTLFNENELKELAALPEINELRMRFLFLLGLPFRNLLRLFFYHQQCLLFILNQLVTRKESLPTP